MSLQEQLLKVIPQKQEVVPQKQEVKVEQPAPVPAPSVPKPSQAVDQAFAVDVNNDIAAAAHT